MGDIVVTFTAGQPRIGLVVRGKLSASHHPDLLAQHADVILSDGSPIGFYGQDNGRSGNGIGLRMQGTVYAYADMRIQRPFYVDATSAMTNRIVSTVLLVTVTITQAQAFSDAWTGMTLSAGDFNIVGGNCSTHASAAFIAAGVLSHGIPTLDTPDRLYEQIVGALPAKALLSLTGFIGFSPAAGGGYDLVVKPYIDHPAHNRPTPTSAGSLDFSAAA